MQARLCILFVASLILCRVGVTAQHGITYTYRTDSFSLYGMDAAMTADGGYVLLAHKEAAPEYPGFTEEALPTLGSLIIKLDNNGNEQWRYFHKNYYDLLDAHPSAKHLLVLESGNIAMPFTKYVGFYPFREQSNPFAYCPTHKVGLLVISSEGDLIIDTLYGEPFCTRYTLLDAQTLGNHIYMLCGNDDDSLEWWSINEAFKTDSILIPVVNNSKSQFEILLDKQVVMFTQNYSESQIDVFRYNLEMRLLDSFALAWPTDLFTSTYRFHQTNNGGLYLFLNGYRKTYNSEGRRDIFSIMYGFNAKGNIFDYRLIEEKDGQCAMGLPNNGLLLQGIHNNCLQTRIAYHGSPAKVIDSLCGDFGFSTIKYLSPSTYGLIGNINEGDRYINGSTVGIYFKASALPITNTSENPFSFYPNPTVSAVSFPWQQELMGGYFQAYSISGQLIFERKLGLETTVDISSLAPGMYICRMLNEQKQLLHIGKVVRE